MNSAQGAERGKLTCLWYLSHFIAHTEPYTKGMYKGDDACDTTISVVSTGFASKKNAVVQIAVDKPCVFHKRLSTCDVLHSCPSNECTEDKAYLAAKAVRPCSARLGRTHLRPGYNKRELSTPEARGQKSEQRVRSRSSRALPHVHNFWVKRDCVSNPENSDSAHNTKGCREVPSIVLQTSSRPCSGIPRS